MTIFFLGKTSKTNLITLSHALPLFKIILLKVTACQPKTNKMINEQNIWKH